MMETLILDRPTSKKLDHFIEFAHKTLIPFYNSCNAFLKAAWISSETQLFQVTQLVFFDDIQTFSEFSCKLDENESVRKQIDHFMAERTCELFKSASPLFIEVLDNTIALKKPDDVPSEPITIATLEAAPDQIEGFIPLQESTIQTGMPLIGFLKSITGKQNRIVDIWKTDLQAGGYQPLNVYESLGMPDEWWEWIRGIAPREKMVKASLLPYSPLQ